MFDLLLRLAPAAWPALRLIALVLLGAALSTAIEHKSPWGLSAKIAARDAALPGLILKSKQDGARLQAQLDAGAFSQWKDALAQCHIQSEADAKRKRADLIGSEAFASKQAQAAFRLGRSTCGGANAPSVSNASDDGSSGGVRPQNSDFAGWFNAAAYTPSIPNSLSR